MGRPGGATVSGRWPLQGTFKPALSVQRSIPRCGLGQPWLPQEKFPAPGSGALSLPGCSGEIWSCPLFRADHSLFVWPEKPPESGFPRMHAEGSTEGPKG